MNATMANAPLRHGRPRRAHMQGLALVGASVVSGIVIFIGLAGWGGNAKYAIEDGAAFGPPSTLAGSRGQDAAARESLVLRSDNRGQVLFGRYCDSCHPAGNQGAGSDLRAAQLKRQFDTPEKVVAEIRKGGFDMPAFPATFVSDADANDIAAYVVALPEKK